MRYIFYHHLGTNLGYQKKNGTSVDYFCGITPGARSLIEHICGATALSPPPLPHRISLIAIVDLVVHRVVHYWGHVTRVLLALGL